MELRRHPRMTWLGRPSWPPEWLGRYDLEHPLPRGEVGILTAVELASSVLAIPHCVLTIVWNDREYMGSLYIEDETIFSEVVALLRKCLGRPIAEIGSLDVP